jgi:hypothetical protein
VRPRRAEAKNKSSLAMADKKAVDPAMYLSTSSREFGPKERLAKTPYPKNPLPDFIHFGADLMHPSLYNGYQAR